MRPVTSLQPRQVLLAEPALHLLCKRARSRSRRTITGRQGRLRARSLQASGTLPGCAERQPCGGGQDSFDEFANPDDTYEELLDRLEGVADTQVRPLWRILPFKDSSPVLHSVQPPSWVHPAAITPASRTALSLNPQNAACRCPVSA